MEASSRGASEGATSAGRGQIGRQTFELAHNLIREGKKPTEAFAIVAENTGRSAATVATAYYRVARTIPGGAGVKQRSRRRRAAPNRLRQPRDAAGVAPDAARPRASCSASSSTPAAALAQHVERLEKENAEYRKIAAALERLQLSR